MYQITLHWDCNLGSDPESWDSREHCDTAFGTYHIQIFPQTVAMPTNDSRGISQSLQADIGIVGRDYSFHMLSNSLFVNHPTIPCWGTDSDVK